MTTMIRIVSLVLFLAFIAVGRCELVCGTSSAEASKCQTRCPSGMNIECPSGESCFHDVLCTPSVRTATVSSSPTFPFDFRRKFDLPNFLTLGSEYLPGSTAKVVHPKNTSNGIRGTEVIVVPVKTDFKLKVLMFPADFDAYLYAIEEIRYVAVGSIDNCDSTEQFIDIKTTESVRVQKSRSAITKYSTETSVATEIGGAIEASAKLFGVGVSSSISSSIAETASSSTTRMVGSNDTIARSYSKQVAVRVNARPLSGVTSYRLKFMIKAYHCKAEKNTMKCGFMASVEGYSVKFLYRSSQPHCSTVSLTTSN